MTREDVFHHQGTKDTESSRIILLGGLCVLVVGQISRVDGVCYEDPLSWLKDYVDITLSPEALAERLTLAGMEVESITRIGDFWDRDKLFVGQILTVGRHPEADRLTLVRVDYGAETGPLTVVTGAPNLYPYIGQDLSGGRGPKVAFAVAGARLYDGHSEEKRLVRLKSSKIRGIESQGMVCSEKELGSATSMKAI